MNSYFDLCDDQKSIVSELTSGVPCKAHDAYNLIG